MSFLTAMIILALLVLHIYAAMQFGETAVEKGHESKKGIVIVLCILVPVAGYLLVCAMADKKKMEVVERIQQTLESDKKGQNAVMDELPDL